MSESYNSRHFAIIIGAAITSILVYYAGSMYGPGLTYDSVNYLYAGHALYEKGRLLRPLENPYIEWPPLYPVIIAGLHFFGNNLLQSVLFFQVIVAGASAWLTGLLLINSIENKIVFYTSLLAITFASPLLVINHFVWSESFFILLSIIYMHTMLQFLRKPTYIKLCIITIVGCMLCLQRHTGLFVIVAGTVIIWFSKEKMTLQTRILNGCIHGILSVALLFCWWTRNYLNGNNVFNEFVLIKKSHMQHFFDYNHVFTSWFLPDELPVLLRTILLYISIITIIYLFLIKNKTDSAERRSFSWQTLTWICACMFTCYFILLYASINGIDVLDDRILSPAYIPGFILLMIMIDKIMINLPVNIKKIVAAGCVLWALYPVSRSLVNVHTWHNLPKQLPAGQPVEEEFRRYILR